MLKEIISSDVAREFLNAVPFDEYISPDLNVCNEHTLILGYYIPELVACFPCIKRDGYIEIHVAIDKKYRGSDGVMFGKEALEWIFSNTNYRRIVAKNLKRPAAIYAGLCGMRRNGNIFEVTHG